MERAAIGFRVKSGWATLVLLGGSARAPKLLDQRTLELSDPRVPESRQPYHPGLDRPGAGGVRVVARLVKGVERFAARSLRQLFAQYRHRERRLVGVGIVVGSVIDPATIGNEHIRAHALEGRLFREVIERAARVARLQPMVVVEKRLMAEAVRVLRRPSARVRETVGALGESISGPWRAEQKAAALAAWMALAAPRK